MYSSPIVSLFALFIMTLVSNRISQQFNQEISYTEFLEKVEAGEVESIKYTGTQINITQKKDKENATCNKILNSFIICVKGVKSNKMLVNFSCFFLRFYKNPLEIPKSFKIL